jgi:hypothetical protein
MLLLRGLASLLLYPADVPTILPHKTQVNTYYYVFLYAYYYVYSTTYPSSKILLPSHTRTHKVSTTSAQRPLTLTLPLPLTLAL